MPIVRLPGGSLRDEIRNPIYDTIDIDAAESPIGIRNFYSNVQGKTLAQSNLRQNNLLETAVSFRVQGLGIDCMNYYLANDSALPIIADHSSLKLKIGEKDYWAGPMILAGGRIYSMNADPTKAFQHFGDNAVASVILKGKHVVDINPLQSFNCEWVCDTLTAAELALATPAADTKLRFLFSLKGLLRRPVQ